MSRSEQENHGITKDMTDHQSEFRKTNEKGVGVADAIMGVLSKLKPSRRTVLKSSAALAGGAAYLATTERLGIANAQEVPVLTAEATEAIRTIFGNVNVQIGEDSINLGSSSLDVVVDQSRLDDLQQVLDREFGPVEVSATNKVHYPEGFNSKMDIFQVFDGEGNAAYVCFDKTAESAAYALVPESNLKSSIGLERTISVTATANFRATASTTASILGSVTESDRVAIVDEATVSRDGFDWLQVRTADGRVGYVATQFLNVNEQSSIYFLNPDYVYVSTEVANETPTADPENSSEESVNMSPENNHFPLPRNEQAPGLYSVVAQFKSIEATSQVIQGTNFTIRALMNCDILVEGELNQIQVPVAFFDANTNQTILLIRNAVHAGDPFPASAMPNLANGILTVDQFVSISISSTQEGTDNSQMGQYLSEIINEMTSSQQNFIDSGAIPTNHLIYGLDITVTNL